MAGSANRKGEENYRGPKRKGGQAVTEQEWEQIVVLAMRGNSVPAISRMIGFHERTIRRFMVHGFPRAPWGQTPIRTLIEHEQAKARALRERIGEDRNDPTPFEAEEKAIVEAQLGAATLPEREAAKRDALASRTQEGQLVKLARGNVLALAGAAVSLVGPANRLAVEIGARIGDRVKLGNLKAEDGIALLKSISSYLKEIVETGHKAMEMERLLLGDPSAGGKLASDAANMSLDDAMTELGNAARVHAAITARGWTVHKGGGATVAPPPPQKGITLDAVSSALSTPSPDPATAAPEDPTP